MIRIITCCNFKEITLRFQVTHEIRKIFDNILVNRGRIYNRSLASGGRGLIAVKEYIPGWRAGLSQFVVERDRHMGRALV